jgi:hypothetical protein
MEEVEGIMGIMTVFEMNNNKSISRKFTSNSFLNLLFPDNQLYSETMPNTSAWKYC